MRKIVFHPFIFAIYPVLALYNTNLGEISASQMVRALMISLLITILLYFVLRWVFGDKHKSGVMIFVLLLIFFSYGHVYIALNKIAAFDLIVRHRYFVIIASGLLIFVFLWLRQIKKDLTLLTWYLNLVCLFLLIWPLIGIGSYLIRTVLPRERQTTAKANGTNEIQPDVYYIILDGYGREDVLKNLFGYDNSGFINALREKGFYIADSSSSNYAQTLLSLGSSLNMDYMEKVASNVSDRLELGEYVRHSQVRRIFEAHSYKILAFDTGYHPTSIEDADVFIKRPHSQNTNTIAPLLWPLNEFEWLLLKTTIVKAYIDPLSQRFNSSVEAGYLERRNLILNQFDALAKVPEMDGNYFVFAHILALHPPAVFGPKGETVQHRESYGLTEGETFIGTPQDYIEQYTGQETYINDLTLKMIDDILANSNTPPIIIIQGDHGSGAYLKQDSVEDSNLYERMNIFNAYYFPDHKYGNLYPSISPVNSFRVVFNQFFGENYPLLEDHHYFSTWNEPFNFINVDDSISLKK